MSKVRQAGTTPEFERVPKVGLKPTIPLSAAGTRPEPAVSVPREKLTSPRETAMAEPELEPPGIISGSRAFFGAGNGVRVPTNPVANWSRFVLPMRIAPARNNKSTTNASSLAM